MQLKSVRALMSAGAMSALLLGIGITGQSVANAEDQRVMVYDNEGAFNPVDPRTGEWGYMPFHVNVTQGEKITFAAEGTRWPHTVTSIEWSSRNMEAQLSKAGRFNSSPTQEEMIRNGNEWVLDTTELPPAHYVYYCYTHPWMVGTFTVVAPPQM